MGVWVYEVVQRSKKKTRLIKNGNTKPKGWRNGNEREWYEKGEDVKEWE
jgi:hypothetical protein